MFRFDVLTVLPESLDSYINTAIIKRAVLKKKIKINIYNLRDWSDDNYKSVDDHPYGGGAGMIMRVDIIYKALKKLKALGLKKKDKTKVVVFAANGQILTQKKLEELSKLQRLVLICGRYEGIDNRVAEKLADEIISVGPYVLTGGEIPALTVIDGVTRLLPDIIKKESLQEESFSNSREKGEYPQYTRPEKFYPETKNKKKHWDVPKVLLEGNHKKIEEWRANTT